MGGARRRQRLDGRDAGGPPRLRRALREASEPKQGLSHARNRAVAEARGDWILFTDDDGLVERGWLSAFWEAFRLHPDAAFFGGPIAPLFEGGPPGWLARGLARLEGAYAALDLGPEPLPLTDARRLPFGCNMAVRRAPHLAFRYDQTLGRAPGRSIPGEETRPLADMLAAGLEGRWVPGARVRHSIPRERQTVGHVRRYFGGAGAWLARHEPIGATVLGRPWRFLWRVIGYEALYRLGRIDLPAWPAHWVEMLKRASRARGAIEEYARSRGGGPPPDST